jgi:signal transduction histidine kinase
MAAIQSGDRARIVAGWSVAAVTMALFATIPISISGGAMARPRIVDPIGSRDLWFGLIVAGFALSGGFLVQARPRNPIGWLLLASGFLQALNPTFAAYGARALTDPDQSLPWGLAAMWLASWSWIPSLLLPAIVLPPLYPTGRVPSPFWAWHVRISLAGIGLLVLAAATSQGGVDDTVSGVRLPWDAPPWWSLGVALWAAAILIPAALLTVAGTLARAIRASYPERQQLLWLLSVVTAMLATVFAPTEGLFSVAYGLVPIAITVGVLRYKLLGIEVVLRRTLLYVPLTLLVALIVGGFTTVFARLVPQGPLPLIAASAVVAVLVIPVASRLRQLVDWLVLGERLDPLTLVDRVGAGMELARDDPVASMLEAVAIAVGASDAVVRDETGAELAVYGVAQRATLEVPLRHNGTVIGTLGIGSRPGEPRISDRDARLLLALAPHLAVVVDAQRLTADLAVERERVTTATLAERDRLRRDLHDGLGPSLSGIALGLEAATVALQRRPHDVPALLQRTRIEADSAVREIRRVVDGLRPAALDQRGLAGAVRETAHSLGMGTPGRPRFELSVQAPVLLPPQVEESAFRIVAESMTNVARHAGASRCTVEIRQQNGSLLVGVLDDGHGIDADHPPGHGLESMAKRASDLGGHVRVAAAVPHGTRVSAVLPMAGTP